MVISAKKQRKTTEWQRLEISSRKLEISREPFHAKMGTIKDRNSMDLKEAEAIKKTVKNTQKKYTRKILVMQVTTMV